MAGEFGFAGLAEALARGRESRQEARFESSRQAMQEREFGLQERRFEADLKKELRVELDTVTAQVRADIALIGEKRREGLGPENFPGVLRATEGMIATISKLNKPLAIQLNSALQSALTAQPTGGILAKQAGEEARITAEATLKRPLETGEPEQLVGFEQVALVRPDVLDETGAVKREVSAEIRKQAAQMLGGSVETALPADIARISLELGAETERVLEAGEEDSVGQAMALAMKRVDLPEALSFSEIAKRGIAAVEQEASKPPTQTELAGSEQKLRVNDATGALSAFVDFFGNRIIGQIDSSFVDPDVVTARQRLALLENEFVVAFKRSPRLPVWEQIKLSRIFQGPAILASPEAVRVELQNIEQLLTENIEINRRLLEAPVPIETKQEALGDIISLAGFRTRIRAFELNPSFPEFRTLEDVGKASIEDLRGFVERTPEAELNLLPPEVINSMSERLTRGQ